MRNARSCLLLVMAFSIALFAGCASTKLATPSGRPEVLVATPEEESVKDAVLSQLALNGYCVISETKNSFIFTKQMEGTSAVLYKTLLGNSYSSDPVWEINVTFVKLGNATKVYANAFVSMQNAFGRTDREDVASGKTALQLQELLTVVKTQLEEGGNLVGRIGVLVANQAVESLAEGSPAEQAGIQPGDKIISADGVFLNGNHAHDGSLLRGEPGSDVVLAIERETEQIEVSVTRGQ